MNKTIEFVTTCVKHDNDILREDSSPYSELLDINELIMNNIPEDEEYTLTIKLEKNE